MSIRSQERIGIAAVLIVLASLPAQGALISVTLGNSSPGFNDGDTPSLVAILAAQSGQPAPFNAGIGNEVLGPSFSALWTFSYSAIVDPITQAWITIGIVDHDSSSPGSQVALFSGDAVVLTTELDTLLEASGGANNMYNVYKLTLPGSIFTNLADGSAAFTLTLQGPVLTPPLLGGDPVEEPHNAATLIYSTLEISTDPIPGDIPEPSTLTLLGLGVTLGILMRRRGFKGIS